MIKTYTITCPHGHGEYTSPRCDDECPACADGVSPTRKLHASGYTEAIDPDRQITTEEDIAALLLRSHQNQEINEWSAGDLGRDILTLVLREFRPDLIVYTALKPSDKPPPYIQVEYDRRYTGGEYPDSYVGEYAYVPKSLAVLYGLERAFTRYTGISAVHIVRYENDSFYDKDGHSLDD